MDKLELIKTWKEQEQEQDRPKFPPPKFQIGDWVIYTGDDTEEAEKAYMVTGMSLDFYKHMGRFVWYYDFSDKYGVAVSGDDGDDWKPADPDPERSPYPPVCECWKCHKIRVDDGLRCVECDADPTPF